LGKRNRVSVDSHHEVPRSRGGKDGKVVFLPKDFHSAWHIVFGNMMREEIVEFVSEVNKMMIEQDTITAKELDSLRERIKKS